MNVAYLLLGGNMGDRQNHLNLAKKAIEAVCGQIINTSSIYETAAWGMEDQNTFYNQAVLLHTQYDVYELLQHLLNIEYDLGRERAEKYGPRIIDIDIIFFNDEVVDCNVLTVPHAQMQYRRFVLQPLYEIAPTKVHPVLKKTVQKLLEECSDKLSVTKVQ